MSTWKNCIKRARVLLNKYVKADTDEDFPDNQMPSILISFFILSFFLAMPLAFYNELFNYLSVSIPYLDFLSHTGTKVASVITSLALAIILCMRFYKMRFVFILSLCVVVPCKFLMSFRNLDHYVENLKAAIVKNKNSPNVKKEGN